jgi:hypothetical protein
MGGLMKKKLGQVFTGWILDISRISCGWILDISRISCGWILDISRISCGWILDTSRISCISSLLWLMQWRHAVVIVAKNSCL